MKKLLTISLAVFYLATASGVTVNVHYCMGQVVSVKLFLESNGCCCIKENPMEGCCDDESFFFQIADDHKVGKTFQTLENQQTRVQKSYEDAWDLKKILHQAIQLEFLDLPPPKNQPIWLLNCKLTYYG